MANIISAGDNSLNISGSMKLLLMMALQALLKALLFLIYQLVEFDVADTADNVLLRWVALVHLCLMRLD